MHEKLTNLLPSDRLSAFSRGYLLRVVVVATVLLTTLALAAAALLIPTYVYLTGSEGAKEKQLSNVESTLVPAEDAALSSRLTLLANNASTLVALSKVPSVSSILRATLAVSRAGVTLSGFSYTPATEKKVATLTISGSAATREALRNYQLALQDAPFARAAALPVSAYAKDSDIAFTITVTLAPTTL